MFSCIGTTNYVYTKKHTIAYNTEHTPVYVDETFSAADKISIKKALDEWNYALNGYREYYIQSNDFGMEPNVLSNDDALIILNVPKGSPIDDAAPEDVLAFVPKLGEHTIFILNNRIKKRNLQIIVMHEIGHTMKIPHTKMMGSLMTPNYSMQAGCIDRATLEKLTEVSSKYNWKKMNYCYSE